MSIYSLFYLKQKIECEMNETETWSFIKNNSETLKRRIKSNIFLRIALFGLKFQEATKHLKISRPNPFWDYTTLKVKPSSRGSIIEISSIPQPIYDYVVLVLLTILFIMLIVNFRDVLFFSIPYLGFLFVVTINLITKYRSFYILTTFCMDVFAHRKSNDFKT